MVFNKIPETNILTDTLDLILAPFMWFLNGFKYPLQETHKWHVESLDNFKLDSKKALNITKTDKTAKYSHGSPFGLFHMPIFGGLTNYIVVQASGYKKHWHIIWGGENGFQIHKLAIRDNKLKLLVGRGGYKLYGIDDRKKFLKLKMIGHGKIGDGKFKGVRLF